MCTRVGELSGGLPDRRRSELRVRPCVAVGRRPAVRSVLRVAARISIRRADIGHRDRAADRSDASLPRVVATPTSSEREGRVTTCSVRLNRPH